MSSGALDLQQRRYTREQGDLEKLAELAGIGRKVALAAITEGGRAATQKLIDGLATFTPVVREAEMAIETHGLMLDHQRHLAHQVGTLETALAASEAKLAAALQRIDKLEGEKAILLGLTHVDPLTGLVNRRKLDEELAIAENELERGHYKGVGFIMIDVDNFKAVNDNIGHEAGDTVLRQIAQALQRHVRPNDTVARYGGEEIGVVLKMLPSGDVGEEGVLNYLWEHLNEKADMLRQVIEKENIQHKGRRIPITISLGVNLASSGAEMGSLIENADQALLRAKGTGRNKVCLAAGAPVEEEAMYA